MIIDLQKMIVSWDTGRKYVEFKVENSWKMTEVYIYCVIFNKKNEVELSSLSSSLKWWCILLKTNDETLIEIKYRLH